MKKRNIFLVLFDSEKVMLPLVACCCLRRPTERSNEWSLQTALSFIYFHGHQMVFDSFMHNSKRLHFLSETLKHSSPRKELHY